MHVALSPVLQRYRALLRAMPRNARLYLAAEALAAVATGTFGVVYNLFVLALGHDAAFLGTLLTTAGVGAGAGAVCGGPLVDRFGPRRVLLGASLVTAAGMAAQLVLPAKAFLLAGSAVAGIGAAAYAIAAAPFLARNTGDAPRDDLFSFDSAVILACGALGTAAAGQAATTLLDSGLGAFPAYRAVLLAGGAIGALSFPALLLTGPDQPPADLDASDPEIQPGPPRWQDVIRAPSVWRLAVVTALIGLGAGLFAPYLNLFFVEALGATLALFGWLSAGATGTRIVATLLAPPLAARLGTVRAIAWTQLASVPLLLTLAFGPTLAVAGTAFLVRGALMNMSAPLQASFRMGAIPAALLGSGNAAIWIAGSAAGAAGTWIGGALIPQAGYRLPYLATAACYVTAAALFLLWFGRKQAASPPNEKAGLDAPPPPAAS